MPVKNVSRCTERDTCCKRQLTNSNSGSIPPSIPKSLSPLPDANPAGTPSSPSAIGVDLSFSLRICGPGGIVTMWLAQEQNYNITMTHTDADADAAADNEREEKETGR